MSSNPTHRLNPKLHHLQYTSINVNLSLLLYHHHLLLLLLIEPHICKLMKRKPENQMQDKNASLTTSTHSKSTSWCFLLTLHLYLLNYNIEVMSWAFLRAWKSKCTVNSLVVYVQVIFLQIIVVRFLYLHPVLFWSDFTFRTRPPCPPYWKWHAPVHSAFAPIPDPCFLVLLFIFI